MTGTMMTVMLVLFALSVPIAIAIGIAAIAGIHFHTNFPLLVAAQQMFVRLDSFPLAAIPIGAAFCAIAALAHYFDPARLNEELENAV